MGKSDLLGGWGEALAAEYLRKKRYTIVAAGYHCRFGEIDLIAKDKKFLVFVEVKLRKPGVSGTEAVDAAKRRRISRAAVVYMAKTGGLDRSARFDVAEVAFDGVQMEIHHIVDAFPLSRGRYFV